MLTASHPGRSIWIEVEDLYEYFAVNPRPSGIQRLAFELMRELVLAEPTVRFVRRARGVGVREVTWQAVQALFAPAPAPDGARPGAAPVAARRPSPLREVWRRLPVERRQNVLRAIVLQKESTRNVHALLRLLRPAAPVAPAAPKSVPAVPAGEGASLRPGDWLLVLGAPWAVPGFGDHLRWVKERHGVQVAVLMYDLIPVRNPEWCTHQAVASFTDWLRPTLRLADRLLAISHHTAQDVEAYAREEGIALPGPVAVVPVGTGFSDVVAHDRAPAPGLFAPGLPAPGTYVLFVSTLEQRKNHGLLVRVWRRLAEDVRAGRRPAASVPDLVFAGRVGWLMSDMMAQLDNTAWLGGRVRLIRAPSDDELRVLYDGCLFTMLPSLSEGWGLPVTESLAAGKPCLAAGTTALPEAGGGICRYFDPDDVGSAYAAVVALLESPGAIAAWQEQVRREFRPTPWADTARAVLRAVASPARSVAA